MAVITRVKALDFQSLEKVELELGKLTVLVGPSNSGKSAVLRAIRAVAHNVVHPSVIVAHGAKRAVVQVDDITLERGASHSRYLIGDTVFAKAGTSVPDEVAALLRFVEVEGEDLNFALQFDRPFLLDAPATKVAKVFGDLTGINLIYDAVREAERRRRDASAKLKVRREDVDRLTEEVQQYADLPDQRVFVASAVKSYWRAVELNTRIDAVEAQVAIVERAEEALASFVDLPELVEFPYEEQIAALREVVRLVQSVAQSETDISGYESQMQLVEQELAESAETYHEMLVEAGQCPTCGQPVR